MKFSTQEEYGLRCLMQLARQGESASLTITQLSELEGISVPNVAKILRLLRRAQFVKSTRGQAGGYALAMPPGQIVVGEVLRALGQPLFDQQFCERHAGIETLCLHAGDCSLQPLLSQVQETVDQVLGRLTLLQLVGRGRPPRDLEPRPGPHAVPLPLATTAGRR